MRKLMMSFFATLVLVSSVSGAEDGVFLTAEEAGPDYAIQGEYSGEIKIDDQAIKLGFQVIALGDHKFDGVAYPGGLPGDGWNGDEKFRASGSTTDGETKIKAVGT
jgi:hypothetical protein